MFKLPKFVPAFIFIISVQAFAGTKLIQEDKNNLTLSVTEQMVMGDNDTLTSARALNIENIKKIRFRLCWQLY